MSFDTFIWGLILMGSIKSLSKHYAMLIRIGTNVFLEKPISNIYQFKFMPVLFYRSKINSLFCVYSGHITALNFENSV